MATLPNLLSLLRIALIPLLVYLLMFPGRFASGLAALTFFVASFTDFLDGYFARRQGVTTTVGKFLDPLADKLLVAAALIMLTAMDRSPQVPAWLVVIIIGREFAVTGLRAIASSEGIVLAAEELGKYKMLCQTFAVHGLIIHYQYMFVNFYVVGMYFLWISVLLSLWSGVDYHLKVFRQVHDKHRPSVTPHPVTIPEKVEARR
ncbi:MAG: CDP-diacylglycerol--glycerol-3-phosphate 3-phosphatidyltransferase [Candidatus Binatia bacterium]